MSKLKPIEVLAKIKYQIKKHYENLGREGEDFTDSDAIQLVQWIDELLTSVEIPKKYLIVEELEDIKNDLDYIKKKTRWQTKE